MESVHMPYTVIAVDMAPAHILSPYKTSCRQDKYVTTLCKITRHRSSGHIIAAQLCECETSQISFKPVITPGRFFL